MEEGEDLVHFDSEDQGLTTPAVEVTDRELERLQNLAEKVSATRVRVASSVTLTASPSTTTSSPSFKWLQPLIRTQSGLLSRFNALRSVPPVTNHGASSASSSSRWLPAPSTTSNLAQHRAGPRAWRPELG